MTEQNNHPIARYRRENGNQSQEALAKVLSVSGVTVSRWETGARKIDEGVLPRVSEITGIPKSVLRPDLAKLMGEASEVNQ